VDSGPFISAITPILIMSFEICARLDDALIVAKAKATHRLAIRPSVLMEVLPGSTSTIGCCAIREVFKFDCKGESIVMAA
jgi:hypothetical protein